MSNAAQYFDMTAAPMRIASVRLKVRDLEAVSAFYQSVIGLAPMWWSRKPNLIWVLGPLSSSTIRLIGAKLPSSKNNGAAR